MKDIIIERVVKKIEERSAVGIIKYKTTLHDNNKDNYLKHLQEELMDAVNYIEKLMLIEHELTELVKNYPDNSLLGEKVRKLIN